MSSESNNNDRGEDILSAASGYATVVLGIVCFVVLLVVIAAIVRIIVGASAGV